MDAWHDETCGKHSTKLICIPQNVQSLSFFLSKWLAKRVYIFIMAVCPKWMMFRTNIFIKSDHLHAL